MIARYYANAKLLISGEYLVSRGANALAIPLKLGQQMEVDIRKMPDDPCINWCARVLDHDWFHAEIRLPEMDIRVTNDEVIAIRLVEILRTVAVLHEGLLQAGYKYNINTQSAFDHSWGLGSSSALITNLARWAQINPFDLFYRISQGSGYDVAAAMAQGPILFNRVNQNVQISPVGFQPSFRHHIFFGYQGKKEDTTESLDHFNRQIVTGKHDNEVVNAITQNLLHAGTLSDFMHHMHEHELFLSRLLQKHTVQEEKFNDFQGAIKSLGAWGGDFIMIASAQRPEYIRSYFATKGIQPLFSFEELVLI